MKTLQQHITEKLVLNNKSKIRAMATCHPDYDELQKKKPKFDFTIDAICDCISNLIWAYERDGEVFNLDYPGFDHGVDCNDIKKSFRDKLEKCGSLHSICYVLNEKWSDEDNCPSDDRWSFYSCLATWYEDLGYFEEPYHCEDLEHYIIYNDKALTNKLLAGSWLK